MKQLVLDPMAVLRLGVLFPRPKLFQSTYLQPICLLVQLGQAHWAGVGLCLWVKVKGRVCSAATLLTSEPCGLSAPGSETE